MIKYTEKSRYDLNYCDHGHNCWTYELKRMPNGLKICHNHYLKQVEYMKRRNSILEQEGSEPRYIHIPSWEELEFIK